MERLPCWFSCSVLWSLWWVAVQSSSLGSSCKTSSSLFSWFWSLWSACSSCDVAADTSSSISDWLSGNAEPSLRFSGNSGGFSLLDLLCSAFWRWLCSLFWGSLGSSSLSWLASLSLPDLSSSDQSAYKNTSSTIAKQATHNMNVAPWSPSWQYKQLINTILSSILKHNVVKARWKLTPHAEAGWWFLIFRSSSLMQHYAILNCWEDVYTYCIHDSLDKSS